MSERTIVENELDSCFGQHVVQYSPEYSLCAGCKSCTILCGLFHEGFTGPGNGRIKVNIQRRTLLHEVMACYHCADHPCYEACPKKGTAMKIDEQTGVVYVDPEFCIGCGMCERHCRFTPSRISMIRDHSRKNWKAAKCDLCRTRPEGPACVQYCPMRCIGLSKDSEYTGLGLFPVQEKKGGDGNA